MSSTFAGIREIPDNCWKSGEKFYAVGFTGTGDACIDILVYRYIGNATFGMSVIGCIATDFSIIFATKA